MNVLSAVIAVISIFWALVQPDSWVWALGFAVVTISLLRLAYGSGVRNGWKSAMSMESLTEAEDRIEEKTEARAQLEAFETAMAEAELFAYELKQGLVPDGNTENNPGYGPMDFDEWRKWKDQEFERTGNLWHNHPGGLPPKEKEDA